MCEEMCEGEVRGRKGTRRGVRAQRYEERCEGTSETCPQDCSTRRALKTVPRDVPSRLLLATTASPGILVLPTPYYLTEYSSKSGMVGLPSSPKSASKTYSGESSFCSLAYLTKCSSRILTCGPFLHRKRTDSVRTTHDHLLSLTQLLLRAQQAGYETL